MQHFKSINNNSRLMQIQYNNFPLLFVVAVRVLILACVSSSLVITLTNYNL